MASAGLVLGLLLNLFADRASVGNSRPVIRWVLVLLIMAAIGLRMPAVCGREAACAARLASCGVLVLIAVMDLEHRRIPNVLVLVGSALATASSLMGSQPTLSAASLGGLAGLASFALIAAIRPGAMGAGDVKLAGMIGIMTGFPGVLQALVVGILAGGVSAAALMLTGLRKGKHYIPYAPYLVAGALATLLFKDALAGWFACALGAGG